MAGRIRTWRCVAAACVILISGCSTDANEEGEKDESPNGGGHSSDAAALDPAAPDAARKDSGLAFPTDASQIGPMDSSLDASADAGPLNPPDTGPGSPDAMPNAIKSDDFFSGALDSKLWRIVDPVGDGQVTLVGAGTQDAHLRLSIPADIPHDPWRDGNNALRVMQPRVEGDFQVKVKFETKPTEHFQIQGIMVEADLLNFLRFDVHADREELNVYAATFAEGVPKVRESFPVTLTAPIYLRLSRAGDDWLAEYSNDDLEWSVAASFTYALPFAAVGVFVGNAEPTPSAFAANVDYFFNTATPIAPEDSPL